MKKIIKIIVITFFLSLIFTLSSCKNEYTVTFKNDDGTLLKEEKVEEGSSATPPENPTKDGYIFIGWSEDYTNIQKDTTIIAQYEKEIKEYLVKFLDHDGTILKEEKVKENETILPPTNPERSGYTFIGWSEGFTNITTDKIIIALYKENEEITLNKCTVTFNTNSETKVENQYLEKGDNIKEPTPPTKKGYTFLGWYLNNELWNFIGFVVSKDITLEAKWQINTYQINYTMNGGYSSNPYTYTVEDQIILNNPTKDGYTFIGWTTKENQTPNLNQTITNEIGEKHYYANYTPNIYTITFDVNGGEESYNDIDITYDTTYNLTTQIPTRKGYTFLGWYNNSTKLTSGTWKIVEDTTLQAKWQINGYYITYDLYEGTITNPSKYTVEDEIILNNPEKTGYTFIGWTTEENQTPNLNQTITNEIGNKHFYANYTPNIYTITFDVNGGEELENNTLEVEYDSEYDITNIIPVKDNLYFIGWFYNTNEITKDIWKYTNNITVTAKWINLEIFEENGIKYLYLGKYPQTLEEDSTIISALENITTTNDLGYIEYNGNEYKKVASTPYDSSYKFSNGETIGKYNTYYFKVEPILWRILESNDGTYKLLSEMLLDNTSFYTSTSNRTIHGITKYPNNYEYSNIRAWLNGYDGTSYKVDNYTNKGFIDIAFTEREKALINETLVDNSLASTGDSSNPYICNNTTDKIYLLSVSEATNTNYGFSSDYTRYDTARRAIPSDYVRSKGCWMNNNSSSIYYGNGYWWLRSPYDSDADRARVVGYDGHISNLNVDFTDIGVRAACIINL